jgi:hypothetical protein
MQHSRKSPGRLTRHIRVNDIIKRGLSSAQVPAQLEPQGVATSDFRRPDGLSLVPWEGGRCCVWDFTSWDTMATSHIRSASTAAGLVASEAERRKRTKYQDLEPAFKVTLSVSRRWDRGGRRLWSSSTQLDAVYKAPPENPEPRLT